MTDETPESIPAPKLTHLDESGTARMVDVGEKTATRRIATAQAVVHANKETIELIRSSSLKKGDALSTARIAGIFAAKKVDELIPLCHTLPLDNVTIDFEFLHDRIVISALASTTASTGVEMEALTAASVAALTIYDMAKAADRRMVISDIHLLTKSGGRSGEFQW